MNRSNASATVGQALTGFTAAQIFGPNRRVDPPQPTNDPNAPASFVSWSFGDDGGTPLTFGGEWEYFPELVVEIWTEIDLGDHLQLEHADAIEELLKANQTDDFSLIAQETKQEFDAGGFLMREHTWTYRRIE